MTEDGFWEIIALAKQDATEIEERPDSLRRVLADKSPSEVQAFYEHYLDQIEKAYTWDLWGAAYVINGGCSDDGFDYFRDWLISEGQDVFERALIDPETLSDLPDLEEPELEAMRYVAHESYEGKTGKSMEPRARERRAEPAGDEWDEDSLASLYPKLAEKYW